MKFEEALNILKLGQEDVGLDLKSSLHKFRADLASVLGQINDIQDALPGSIYQEDSRANEEIAYMIETLKHTYNTLVTLQYYLSGEYWASGEDLK